MNISPKPYTRLNTIQTYSYIWINYINISIHTNYICLNYSVKNIISHNTSITDRLSLSILQCEGMLMTELIIQQIGIL